jgi:hypothetical protein
LEWRVESSNDPDIARREYDILRTLSACKRISALVRQADNMAYKLTLGAKPHKVALTQSWDKDPRRLG